MGIYSCEVSVTTKRQDVRLWLSELNPLAVILHTFAKLEFKKVKGVYYYYEIHSNIICEW